jgi:hypothetical protein
MHMSTSIEVMHPHALNLPTHASHVHAHAHAHAHADMLQVGSPRLSDTESRTHFAAWCVSSAPLILGYNLADPQSVIRANAIVTNKAAIAVNQVSLVRTCQQALQ